MPIPTEADWALLMEMAREYHNRRGNTQQRPVVPFPVGQAPEVYFVRTPEAGINPELGTGTPALTGYADCEVLFRLFDGTFIDAGFTITVYNLGTEAVGAYELGLAVREKGGTWVFVPTTPGTGGTGSLTVEEADGSPAYGSVSTLIFDQADGFTVSQPAAGQAKVNLTSGGAGTSLTAVRVYTTDATWSKPAGLSFVLVEVVGGGGGGGGAGHTSSGTTLSVGGGGGGGGYAFVKKDAASLGSTESVTVGGGGAGGTAGSSGATTGTGGSASSFGTHAAANGGSGGAGMGSKSGSAYANGGGNGSGTSGDLIATVGSPSTAGVVIVPGSGPNIGIPGTGGSSAYGSGGLAPTQTSDVGSNTSGNGGSGYGGGGSGGWVTGFAASSGGNGSSGVVIVYEYTAN